MIGDRCFDVDSAHALGMYAVGVAYGYGSVEELERASEVLEGAGIKLLMQEQVRNL